MLKVLGKAAILALVAFAITACGVRGSLDPPPSSTPPDAQANATDEASTGASEKSRKGHEPFILDGLLR